MSIFYPPVAGIWTFTTNAWMTDNATGALELYVVKNTSNISPGNSSNSTYIASSGMYYQPYSNANFSTTNFSGTGTTLLTTSDYVCVIIWNLNSNPYTVSTDSNTTYRSYLLGTLISAS